MDKHLRLNAQPSQIFHPSRENQGYEVIGYSAWPTSSHNEDNILWPNLFLRVVWVSLIAEHAALKITTRSSLL